MSLDTTLLRLCTNRGKFDRLVPSAPRDGLDELTVLMLDALRAYYKEFPDTKDLPFDVFDGWAMEFKWKTQPDDKKSLLKVLLKQMREPVPPEAEQGMIEKLLELELATTAVSKIVQWNGGAEFSLRDELAGLAETITDRMDRKARLPLVQETPEELMQMDEHDIGIHFRLPTLARNLRALRGGDFGIYAMRPDAGKTTFLTSESSHWITQLDNVWPDQKRTGIWLNNEGPGKRIKQRWYQSLLGATIPEMVEWAKDGSIRKRIEDAMGGDIHRMQFYDIHGFNSGEVEAIIKQTNPGFIIFDMIDNITFTGGMTNGGQRTDQMLEAMYQAARNWCVKYDAVGVATSQISAEGEGIQYPPQSALKDSKTGKQGACDFIIMGGKLNDPAMERFRYIGTPKNKLHRAGGKRDVREEVMMDAERARFYQEAV
ncbi:DNA helicase [Xanthomonas phage MUD8-T1]|uniref:DNA helicase n=1 Tax=Xanthomonas phage MUD8-T1 TaxID=2886033 RepID=A0AAE9C8C4_9CAUD|nr:DNA helicase [Xanthomonas phage MUD8-T1]UGL62987.1 DNA helicase [Xanthomonas phage R3-22-T1]